MGWIDTQVQNVVSIFASIVAIIILTILGDRLEGHYQKQEALCI